jgi:hypothetical protein
MALQESYEGARKSSGAKESDFFYLLDKVPNDLV